MKKYLLILVAACSGQLNAAISIDPPTRTFNNDGGGGSVLTSGSGSWTASAGESWITITPTTSGVAGDRCTYIVDANPSADTRVGLITIGDCTHKITQTGYASSLSKSSVTLDKNGGTVSVNISTQSSISWSAYSNDAWITVNTSSGFGNGEVSFSVAAYSGSVQARSGTIVIGGNTFTVYQTGPRVVLSPSTYEKDCKAAIVPIAVSALSGMSWTATSQSSWITFADSLTSGVSGGTLTLVVAANKGWVSRVGTVIVEDAVLTVKQEADPDFTFSNDPVEATADGRGAYGGFNVIAPSDNPWTVVSKDSWLTIANGEAGSGNKKVEYVVSANPTTATRKGTVVVTPTYEAPEVDLYAARYDDNMFAPSECEPGWSMAFSFKLDSINCVNRLLTIDGHSLYVSDKNVLVFDETKSSGVIASATVNYTVLLTRDANGRLEAFLGEAGQTLRKTLSLDNTMIADSFTFGQTSLPSPGTLSNWTYGSVRRWARCLTEKECQLVDVAEGSSIESTPGYVPADGKFHYWPFDGNLCGTVESNRSPSIYGGASVSSGASWTMAQSRFNLPCKALSVCDEGVFFKLTRYEDLFNGTGSLKYNGGWYFPSVSGELSSTIVVWLKITDMPSEELEILHRDYPSSWRKSSDDWGVSWSVNTSDSYGITMSAEGALTFHSDRVEQWTSCDQQSHYCRTQPLNCKIPQGEWVQLAFVGSSCNEARVYLNSKEIGCVPTSGDYSLTYGWMVKPNERGGTSAGSFKIGGWQGYMDDLTIYRSALTAAEVKELYEKTRHRKLVHTVTQGVQGIVVNPEAVQMTAAGGVAQVSLNAAASVNWTVVPNAEWITVASASSGVGAATVSLNVQSNPSVLSRAAEVVIAGQTVVVEQAGLDCSVTPFSSVVSSPDGGGRYISVYVEGNASWTATSNDDWLTVALGASGTGNGEVYVIADPMTSAAISRTGSLTIAGKTVYVTQRGYELSVSPSVAEIASNAGQNQFGVSADIGNVWNTIVTEPWITITGSKTGSGDGVVHYSVTENATGATRVGKIIVAGEEYTITQLSTIPVTTAVEGHGMVSGAGGYKKGDTVSLRATPESGYAFSHWTGDASGTSNPLNVTISESLSVTAHFVPLAVSNATATRNHQDKVVVSWDALAWANTYKVYRSTTGNKPSVALVTLAANVWQYEDTAVSANSTYYYWVEADSADSHSCTEAIEGCTVGGAVAPGTEDPIPGGVEKPEWSPAVKEDTLIVYATVYDKTLKTAVETSGSLLAAFSSSGECRGVAEIEDGPVGEIFQLSIGVESPTESGFTLKVWNAATGETKDISGNVTCNSEKVIGTIVAPIEYTVGATEVNISLVEGWNWVSLVVMPEDASVNTILAGGTFANNDVCKSSSKTATYYNGQWYPSSFALTPGAAYMVKKSAGGAEDFAVSGEPMTTGVTVTSGWNWFGSTLNETTTVSRLTHSGGFANNDLVKSSSKSATYYGAWYSSTFEIAPGVGYKAKLGNAGTLGFESPSVVRTLSVRKQLSVVKATSVNAPDWTGVTKEDTLVLYVQIKNPDTDALYEADGTLIAAFDANGECRGVAEIEVGPLGKLFQLSIGVESATETGFSLKLWDSISGQVLECSGIVDSNADKQIGWIFEPVVYVVNAQEPDNPCESGHIEGTGTVIRVANYYEGGIIGYSCSRCGANLRTDVSPKLERSQPIVLASEFTGCGTVALDESWVSGYLAENFAAGGDYVSRFRDRFGDDLVASLKMPTGKFDNNGHALKVWHDYVMGTDPTDPGSLFTASIHVVDGKVMIDWSPNLNVGGETRIYQVKSKMSLENKWSYPAVASHRFFAVGVSMPEEGKSTDSPGIYGGTPDK